MQDEFRKHGLRAITRAWSGPSQMDAFRSLRALIDTQRIELVDDSVLLSEFGRVRESQQGGSAKIVLPRVQDSHCDVLSALAAAVLEHETHPPARPLRVSSVVGRLQGAPTRAERSALDDLRVDVEARQASLRGFS